MPVEVARIEFSQHEYRSVEVQDAAILVKHPLAIELHYKTLLATSADATTFGNQVLSLRKMDRWTWACYVKKDNYPSLEIGQTIRLVYPRYGFDAGKNFIIKRVKTDSNAVFDELTLFGPEGPFGLELVTNGDMSSATGWSLDPNVTISGGAMIVSIPSAAHTSGASQNSTLPEANRSVEVTFVVRDWVSGSIRTVLGGAVIGTYRTGNGFYTERLTTNGFSGFYLQIHNSGGAATFKVDDVSIKEF